MLEGIISTFTDTEESMQGIGGLFDYSSEERKAIAKHSRKYKCEKCGPIADLLIEEETSQKLQSDISHSQQDQ